MNTRSAALLLALAGLVSAPASAQVTRWYTGFALGISQTSSELVRNRESTVTLASDFHSDFDSGDVAAKATVGYRFFPWLAVEVDYTDLGKHSMLSNFLGGDAPAPAQIYLERRIKGFGADAVFSWPIAPQWKLFGRVGACHAERDGVALGRGLAVRAHRLLVAAARMDAARRHRQGLPGGRHRHHRRGRHRRGPRGIALPLLNAAAI
jgi:hypothetical protein